MLAKIHFAATIKETEYRVTTLKIAHTLKTQERTQVSGVY
jgi:hypothetical protein